MFYFLFIIFIIIIIIILLQKLLKQPQMENIYTYVAAEAKAISQGFVMLA